MVLSGPRRRGVWAVATERTLVGQCRGWIAPRPAALVAGLASDLHAPAQGLHRRALVRVDASAASGPGLCRSLLHSRCLQGAARCSRRVRPRRIPPLTGTSLLSPQLMRKVRLMPQRACHLRGPWARCGGVCLVLRWLWPGGDGQQADW